MEDGALRAARWRQPGDPVLRAHWGADVLRSSRAGCGVRQHRRRRPGLGRPGRECDSLRPRPRRRTQHDDGGVTRGVPAPQEVGLGPVHFDLTPEQRAIRDLALDVAEREIVPRRRTSSSVFAKTDPDARAKGISAFLVERSSCGLEVGAEYPVEKLLRDAKVILYEGTSEIQRNIIARELGRRHASTTRTRR